MDTKSNFQRPSCFFMSRTTEYCEKYSQNFQSCPTFGKWKFRYYIKKQ